MALARGTPPASPKYEILTCKKERALVTARRRGRVLPVAAGTHLFIAHVLAESIHGQQHLRAGGQGPAAHAGGQLDALRVVHHVELHARRPLHVEGDGVFGCRSGAGLGVEGEKPGESPPPVGATLQ